MARSRQRWIRQGLALVLLVLFVAWVARQVDGERFVAALRTLPWWRSAAVWACGAAIVVVRTARSQLLLPRGAAYRDVFVAVAVGFVTSVATPLRVGVLVRPWLIQRRCAIPFGTGVAALLAERWLDLASVVVVLFGVLAWALPAAGPGVAAFHTVAWLLLGAAVALFAGLVAVGWIGPARVTARTQAWVEAGGVRATIAAGVAHFAAGARGLGGDPGRTLGAVALTVVMASLGMAGAGVVIDGVGGGGATLARVTTFWVAVMTAIAAVPTPGSFGAYEAAAVTALGVHGMDASTAAAVGVLVHVGLFGGQLLVGAVVTWFTGWPRIRSEPGMAAEDSGH